MLAQQIRMFGQNIYYLIGLLLALGFGSVVAVVCWTGLKIALFSLRRRRSEQLYRQQTRRADGKRYPPVACGFCDACGRSSKSIYHPSCGVKLCAPCYEEYWRRTEQEAV
jgi:hypothetical protein